MRVRRRRAAAAPAAEPSRANSDALSPEIAATERRIAEELHKTTSVQFKNVSLDDALLTLSKRHGIPIRLEFWSFMEKGVILARSATVHVEKTTLRNALVSLVESAIGDAKVEVAATAKQGVLSVGVANVEEMRPGQPLQAADRLIAVRGVIHTVDGRPAAGCEIVVHRGTQTVALVADDQGEFILPMRASACCQSALLFRAASGREAATYTFAEVISADKGVERLNISLQKTRPITVTVTDDAGKPISHARVGITGTQGAFDRTTFDGLTDDAGEFTAQSAGEAPSGLYLRLKTGSGT